MRSSDGDLRGQAEAIVRAILERLDGSYLARHIDEPIDRAIADFVWDDRHPVCHCHFHEVLGKFVAHVYARGLPCRRKLSPAQARDEAVALLEQMDRGTGVDAYEVAVLEAAQSQWGGIEVVLVQLAEFIKAQCRQMHVQWVFAKFIDASDWPLLCAIASVLLDHFRSSLSERVSRWQPAQAVDAIPDLLRRIVNTDSQLRQICGLTPFTS